MTAVIVTCLFLLGELTGQDLAFARSLFIEESDRIFTLPLGRK
jgi:hypothetical protein